MNRRRKILMGIFALCAAPARAQTTERAGKPVRVAILVELTSAESQIVHKPFVDSMRKLGWIEGRNVTYDAAYADRDLARLPALAAALVARRPDVIVVRNTQPALAALSTTRAIPIVFTGVSNPDKRGLVKSLAQPGGNVTGITPVGAELGGKRLQLLKQALPKVTRVGVLVNPSYSPTSSEDYRLIEQAAVTRGVTVVPATVNAAGELDAAFALFAKSRIEAVLTTQNPLFGAERMRILQLAAVQRVPVIGTNSTFTNDGGLMSYGRDPVEEMQRAAGMVDKILKGSKPADIPVEQPTKFELAVNLKTAKALGITIPGEILLQADRVIE